MISKHSDMSLLYRGKPLSYYSLEDLKRFETQLRKTIRRLRTSKIREEFNEKLKILQHEIDSRSEN